MENFLFFGTAGISVSEQDTPESCLEAQLARAYLLQLLTLSMGIVLQDATL